MSDEPTEKLELRITRDLWDAIDRQAKADGRHITSMARLLIERGLLATAQRDARETAQRDARLPPMLPDHRRIGLDKPRKRPR